MANACTFTYITPSDPAFLEARRLRTRVLYEPYGVNADFDWQDDAPGSRHIVAFCRGELVGYGRLDVEGRTAQIRHLSVDPARRGQGLGSELVQALIERAKSEHAEMVFLNARFTALGLYRRFGFAEVGPIFHTEHTHLPHKRMELRLSD